ncbi:MAG TPA: agmatine deiminase family protein [Phycisphaerales bacterium]|nr:agmatine deiminase family protein [Phycisphaerales bacterium]
MSTPSQLGYTLPPEWAPHCATWLSWPRPEGISFPGRYHLIAPNLAGLVRAIALREDVHINVPNENYHRIALEMLAANGVEKKLLGGPSQAVFFHYIMTNEAWCRDHGPAFVVKGSSPRHAGKRCAVVDWKFNAWGGKYPPWDSDDAVPTRIAKGAKLPLFDAPIVMEGGSVDFNGRGTILTTSQCLLNPNRNRGVSRTEVERHLKDYYGQEHVVWLAEGIEGDDTDGHIDDLARFVSPTTVVIGMEENRRDPNHRQLERAYAKLNKVKDQDGNPFNVVTLPMPRRVVIEGQRCPATYMNFHFVNGAVLVPTFGDKATEKRALATLQAEVGDREVIGVDCRELIWGLGSVHCLTQQVPSVPGLRERLRKMAAKTPAAH